MAIELHEEGGGRILDVHASGELTTDDYARLRPELERLIQEHGRISILIELHDFHGWNPEALREGAKPTLRHFDDVDRLAVVGEKRWQEGAAEFWRPFTTAEISYFDHEHEGAARQWVSSVQMAQGRRPRSR